MGLLVDGFNRVIRYLRFSLTSRCNLRCSYCSPGRRRGVEEALSAEEIRRLLSIMASLGLEKVRFTGGEPLLREDVLEIVRASSLGLGLSTTMTTNGQLLAPMARALREAGLRRVNVSLDTLSEARYRAITGGSLGPVLEGIREAISFGLNPLKINVVLLRRMNLDELEEILRFAAEVGAIARFIEFMPVGPSWSEEDFVPASEVLRRVDSFAGPIEEAVAEGDGPARYYWARGGPFKFGVISAVSSHFCGSCNRIRITSSGTMINCLFAEEGLDLRAMLRGGASDGEIAAAVADLVSRKGEGWFALRRGEGRMGMREIGG